MKRGKEVKLDISKNYNVVSGTVDNKNPKSIYISISAWGNPLVKEEMDYTKVINDLDKRIKKTLSSNINKNRFKDIIVTDLDMRESGIKFGKRSYMNCEVTLFQRNDIENLPITSDELLTDIKNVTNNLLEESFENSNHFTFHKTKK
jgi:hypothetical protein